MRAGRESADHAGGNCAAVPACLGRLRGGNGRESKGRGGRQSSECFGLVMAHLPLVR